MQIDLRSKVVG